ncbi:hypothetical protein [Gordonia sputi]
MSTAPGASAIFSDADSATTDAVWLVVVGVRSDASHSSNATSDGRYAGPGMPVTSRPVSV